jgi:hypothetical protein
MHPTEFFWLLEAHTPVKMFGDLREDEVKELLQDVDTFEDNRKATT